MIAIVTVPLAILVLILEGMLLLRLFEGRLPVLTKLERVCMGLFLGQSWSAFALFIVALFGLPLSPWAVIGFHFVFLGTCAALLWHKTGSLRIFDSGYVYRGRWTLPRSPLLKGVMIAVGILVALKLVIGTGDILLTPTYFNDAYGNWNMRAKVFYTNQNLLLDVPRTDEFFFGGHVLSYPLTVYLSKLFMVSAAGTWSDAAAKSINLVWFLSTIGLLWSFLRRESSAMFAGAGVAVLLGMPLVLVHGFSAYTDILMGGHLFAVLCCFYYWLKEKGDQRNIWLMFCGALLSGLLFTKNETLQLFLPPLVLLVSITLLHEWFRFPFFPASNRVRTTTKSIMIAAACITLIAVPWILFKLYHGLDFGNAHIISKMVLTPHEGVPGAIWGAIAYSGSFLFFIPVFLTLLILTIRSWARCALGVIIAFLLIVFTGEFFIFYLTKLATEALRHTGFSRGMVQLMPSAVWVGMVLLGELIGDGDR